MYPFHLSPDQLEDSMEEMVAEVFSQLRSSYMILPKGPSYIEYSEFQAAYETLKVKTAAFRDIAIPTLWEAVQTDALAFLVLRTILGVSPPEWAETARELTGVELTQQHARQLDSKVRHDRQLFRRRSPATEHRAKAMLAAASDLLSQGVPSDLPPELVHRLSKFDTQHGITSIINAADLNVPYPVLLYERYLGRPFASHRDSVSELVGDVMESAIEEQLSVRRVSFRKTRRAERIPGFEQAPDFFIPTEVAPSVIIEAKIASDDGTARDKVTRILRLAAMRDQRLREGSASFEVIACIDGRGFGVRAEDMAQVLRATYGKVFTLTTIDKLVDSTSIAKFSAATSKPR